MILLTDHKGVHLQYFGEIQGEGVVSSPEKEASSAEECRLACKNKIEKNAADESFDTCTGFSWDAWFCELMVFVFFISIFWFLLKHLLGMFSISFF